MDRRWLTEEEWNHQTIRVEMLRQDLIELWVAHTEAAPPDKVFSWALERLIEFAQRSRVPDAEIEEDLTLWLELIKPEVAE